MFLVGAMFLVVDFQRQMHAKEEEIVLEKKEGKYNKKEVIQYAQIYDERAEEFGSLFKDQEQVPTTTEIVQGTSTKSESTEKVNPKVGSDGIVVHTAHPVSATTARGKSD